jgi:hypothetical protein
MRRVLQFVLAFSVLLALSPAPASADAIGLAEYKLILGGGSANLSAFDEATGLGTITVTATGAGPRYISAFFDHEIVETDNTFFNEYGFAVGTAPAGLTWEIDEPGFGSTYTGDIYDNFLAGTLDNKVFGGVFSGPEDVSMALAWSFSGGGVVQFLLGESAPSGFYLEQTDPDSGQSIYLSSQFTPEGVPGVPEAGSLVILGVFAVSVGLVSVTRRLRRA